MNLQPLLNPASIAIVGASGDPKAGPTGPNGTLRNLQRHGYGGRLCVVNPNYKEVGGAPCYPAIDAVPYHIDLAVIGVRGALVPQILEACVAKGVKAAIVITAGFAETGTPEGVGLQERAQAVVFGSDLLVCGPNCLGIVNVLDRVAASASVGLSQDWPKAGTAAFVAQSGSLTSSMLIKAKDQDLGLAYVVSTGNEVGLDICDYVAALADDANVSVVMSFIEGFRDIDKLRLAARRMAAAAKPWIVYKTGRTEVSAEAAKGHTGAIAGSYEIHRGFCRQNGIVLVDELDDLITTAQMFQAFSGKQIAGRRLGILSCSGGSSSILADQTSSHGFTLPRFEAQTDRAIRSLVASWAGGLLNPVDPGPPIDVDPDGIAAILGLFDKDTNCDILIQAMGPRPPENGIATARALARVAKEAAKPLAVGWCTGGINKAAIDILRSENCVVCLQYEALFRALEAVVEYREWVARRSAPEADTGPTVGENVSALLEHRGQLTESEGKALCRAVGLEVPEGRLAASSEEAVAAAQAIGFPVVLKISSRTVLHKTELHGVHLGLRHPDAVAAAFTAIKDAVPQGERSDGVFALVEQDMSGPGCELMVSLMRDQLYGPVVVVALGGVWVEALPIRVVICTPFTKQEARQAILASDLAGFISGSNPRYQFDVDALLDVVMTLAGLGRAPGCAIEHLEINPLLVRKPGQGAVVLDVVASAKSANGSGDST